MAKWRQSAWHGIKAKMAKISIEKAASAASWQRKAGARKWQIIKNISALRSAWRKRENGSGESVSSVGNGGA
jgi:hypothetical protein